LYKFRLKIDAFSAIPSFVCLVHFTLFGNLYNVQCDGDNNESQAKKQTF